MSTIVNSAAPAPASQSHGTLVHGIVPPPAEAPHALTHNRYSAVGNSNGKTTVRKTRSMFSSTGEDLRQIDQHAGRCPPDGAILERQHKKKPGPPFDLARHPPVIARVDNERKRHLERLRHLKRVDREPKRCFDDADDRGDLEA